MRDVLSSNDDKECVHWHNDKHIPKVYSFDNIMDPGPISPALMVIMEFSPLFSYLRSMSTPLFVDTMCRYCHR